MRTESSALGLEVSLYDIAMHSSLEERLARTERLAARLADLVPRLRVALKNEDLDKDLFERLDLLATCARRLGFGDRPRIPSDVLRWEYKTTLRAVRRWRDHLRHADVDDAEDLAQFLEHYPKAAEFAAHYRYKWTVARCRELALATVASEWLRERLAAHYDCSVETIRSRLYRRTKKHAP